jgi:hypothetical protein
LYPIFREKQAKSVLLQKNAEKIWENRGFYKSVLGLCPTARYNISVEKGQFRKEHDPWRN